MEHTTCQVPGLPLTRKILPTTCLLKRLTHENHPAYAAGCSPNSFDRRFDIEPVARQAEQTTRLARKHYVKVTSLSIDSVADAGGNVIRQPRIDR